MISVLFIDDDVQLQKVLKMVLADKYRLIHAFTGEQGLERLQAEEPDVVLLDINLPQMDGLAVLNRIMSLPAPPPVIMLTVLEQTPLIVKAIKAGAYNYLIKSAHTDFDEIKGTIWQAATNSLAYRQPRIPGTFLDEIIGESAELAKVKHQIISYAKNDSPVLILGESGTGKELVAAALHRLSHRSQGPFVPINCGAIPENLVESSLFGSEKGAYTDAVERAGYFEKANRGTIFLDEIGEMSPAAQVKLLRVIESKEFERVGGNKMQKTDIRVIAATNRRLKKAIRDGGFREDLYYRLGVLVISLPPLRNRPEDIPLLAAWFVQKQHGKQKKLSPEALEKLIRYPWPGNVRELKNVLERSLLLAQADRITANHIIFDEEGL